MQTYEYKVVPAPTRGEKERGAKTVQDRFGVALTNLMNAMARDGWEYLRADTLPCEERVGLTGRTTAFQNMLVFRRRLIGHDDASEYTPADALMRPLLLSASEREPVREPDREPVRAANLEAVREGAVPRLGAAEHVAGAAPAVGPVRPELAAELAAE